MIIVNRNESNLQFKILQKAHVIKYIMQKLLKLFFSFKTPDKITVEANPYLHLIWVEEPDLREEGLCW